MAHGTHGEDTDVLPQGLQNISGTRAGHFDATRLQILGSNLGTSAPADAAYFLQNWRADMVAMMRSDGWMPAWFKYTAYGEQELINRADLDDGSGTGTHDGGIDLSDLLYFLGYYETGDPRADLDDGSGTGTPDGGVDINDLLYYNAQYEAGGTTIDSEFKYAGYMYDGRIGMFHVRHRVYSAELGRWTKRDPVGYAEGENLYSYLRDRPEASRDPSGLAPVPGSPVGPPTWALPDTFCMAIYQIALLGCAKVSAPGTFARRLCEEVAYAGYRVCVAGTHLPGDTLGMISCTELPGFLPLAPSPATCNYYPACMSHLGANLRCMCNCMGTSVWSNWVRACIRCGISKGLQPTTVHLYCWTFAPGSRPPNLMFCPGYCIGVQQTTCAFPCIENY